jgi:hypothetical protein
MKSRNYIFVISAISMAFSSSSAVAKANIDTQCLEAMQEVTAVAMSLGSENQIKLKQWIDAHYQDIRLKSFLKQQWIQKLKSHPDFTPNTFYEDKDRYTNACTSFLMR